ncbi:MAG: hypothetical protein KF767_07150 [Bdellovibrionaceae bacterium]|nr:hypothetical protein [Pseudobdellovibrionaceae bacterium]
MNKLKFAQDRTYLTEWQIAVLLALALSAAIFVWQIPYGLNLWDEGFLWYGAQAVLRGEVPIRDFIAYDPFRYYWSSWFMTALGSDGVIPVRYAAMVLQSVSVALGATLMLGRASLSGWRWVMVLSYIVIATLWMLRWYKGFDIFASVLLVFTTFHVLTHPSSARFFMAGVVVGGVAVLGRNHGLYGVVGFVIATVMTSFLERKIISMNRVLLFAIGVVLGFSPQLFMLWLIPGYWAAFLDSVLSIIEMGATNLPLPIPMPWDAFGGGGALRQLKDLTVGLLFLGIGLFVAVPYVLRRFKIDLEERTRLVLIACASFSLPYAHYAYSRADLEHLSLGLYPFLIGISLLALNVRGKGRFAVGVIIILLLMIPSKFAILPWNIREFVAVNISGERLWISPEVQAEIQLIEKINREFSSRENDIAFVPLWPGAYSVLRKISPIWEIYGVLPRNDRFEEKEIALLRKNAPKAILVWNLSLDGREELQYRHTHRATYEYILKHYRDNRSFLEELPYEFFTSQ